MLILSAIYALSGVFDVTVKLDTKLCRKSY